MVEWEEIAAVSLNLKNTELTPPCFLVILMYRTFGLAPCANHSLVQLYGEVNNLCKVFFIHISFILIEHIEAHSQGDIDVELLIAHLFTEQKLFDLADSITDGVVMTLE